MRPLELHVAGFTTFRNPTEVDFADADLFVLSGPTGSGKSSIIDAICFALYGSVPRLKRNDIASVVSLGKNEARIRLRFEVGGEAYTVSRLVVRQRDGASQRDVRLEGGGAVVEGAREVDARITDLLGLGFDHFTRTVVLPQGRFAAFLEDPRSEREALLKQLLDLGVYEEMRKQAAGHASRLDGELSSVSSQLHELLVTDAEIERAETAVTGLRRLAEKAAEAFATLEARSEAIRELAGRRQVIDDELARLEKVTAPEGVDRISEELADARAAATAAEKALVEAESAATEAVARREELGEIAAVRARLEAHARVDDLRARVEEGERLLAEATTALDAANAAEGDAHASFEAATARLGDRERAHAAHALRAGLVAGDICPVCDQIIDVLAGDTPGDLEEARAERTRAETTWREAVERKNAAAAERASVESRLGERHDSLEEALVAVADTPSVAELELTLAAIDRADASVTDARAKVEQASARSKEAEDRLARAAAAGDGAFVALDRARDLVAALEPPVPTRADPATDWESLLAWCAAQREDRSGRREELDARILQLEEERHAVRADLLVHARDAGIDDLGDDPKVTVATALTRAEADLGRLQSELTRKQGLEKRKDTLVSEKATYDEVARLLRSNNFQQWLIEEALVGLVEFANAELAKLAGGAYSLAVDGGDFEVIDHRNAEARRSVKTLSGGETFLVSLALALALAERVVATSAIGTARLESMFLDEGFGTLDAETLETVAAVVQELGTGERMIGLVTHVRELADQIPIRFEVRKLPDSSTVTRVDA